MISMSGGAFAQDVTLPFKQPDVFRAQYTEIKYLPSLKKPIESEGDFIYVKNTGMAWLMTSPFYMKTIITPDGLKSYINDSEQSHSQNTKKTMDVILKNISSIFSGDTVELSKYFEIDSVDDVVTLTPKSDQMARYLRAIELTGRDKLDKVKIVFFSDKYTVLQYKNYKIGKEYITDLERGLFE